MKVKKGLKKRPTATVATKPRDAVKLARLAINELKRFESQWLARSEFDAEVAKTFRANAEELEKLLKLHEQGIVDVIKPLQDTALALLELIESLASPVTGRKKESTKVSGAAEEPGKLTVLVAETPSKAVTRKPEEVKEKPSRKGDINSRAFTILRAAFGQPTMAAALEEALERAYGFEWRGKEISAFAGGGKVVKVTLVQDLGGDHSQLRGALRQAVEKLIEVEQKQPKIMPPMLDTLYKEIIGWQHSVSEVCAVVKTWGCPDCLKLTEKSCYHVLEHDNIPETNGC